MPTAVSQREERRRLVDALASLPELDRAIVELHFFGAMGWDELAEELGLPSGDAARMALVRRVLPGLKRELGAGYRAGPRACGNSLRLQASTSA